MRLTRLSVRDFKGIGSFDLMPEGHNATVIGRNATGKSTLLDAYTWLLFGKDSRGSATFEVRPVDATGEPMHEGEHSVEAEFDLGDHTIVLKRVLSERWSRPRGKAHKEFKGTETTYYVDEAPVKAAVFQTTVAEMFGGEKNAQVLSDPLYFAGSMPWQERRATLLALADDLYDEKVIKDNDDLAELPELLGDNGIEHLRSVAKAKSADLKRKLDQYPGQIREASRGADPAAPSVKAAQAAVAKLEAELADGVKVLEVARATERKAYSAMQEARIAFAQAQSEAQAGTMKARAEVEGELRDVRRQMDALVKQGNRIKDEGMCPECGQPLDKKHADKERKRLRKEYDALNKQAADLMVALESDDLAVPQVDPAPYDEAKHVYEEAKAALAEAEAAAVDSAPLEAARANLRAAEAAEATKTRVAALKAEERATAESYEEAMHHLWLCEEFVRTKVRLLEASINAKFRMVEWRLFEPMHNGGIKEVADATVNGVPWGNLNTGGRLNAGLDIIGVLAGAQDSQVPVWIDNAESLTSMLAIDSQVIQLRVSEDDPELRVIVEKPKVRKAA